MKKNLLSLHRALQVMLYVCTSVLVLPLPSAAQTMPSGFQEYIVLGRETQVFEFMQSVVTAEPGDPLNQVNMESVVTLTATADPGWTFDGWSGDASGAALSTTVTIEGNTSVTATFTQDEYTLTVNL
mgnify:CR=1 FL=1